MDLESNKLISSSKSSISLFKGNMNKVNDFVKNNLSSGIYIGIIDGKESRIKEKLLDSIAKELHFPSYFGKNWDALDECINDLSWIKANRIVLIFINFGHILSKENKREIRILLDILKETVVNWNKLIYLSIVIQFENEPTSEIRGILREVMNV